MAQGDRAERPYVRLRWPPTERVDSVGQPPPNPSRMPLAFRRVLALGIVDGVASTGFRYFGALHIDTGPDIVPFG